LTKVGTQTGVAPWGLFSERPMMARNLGSQGKRFEDLECSGNPTLNKKQVISP